MNKIGDIENEEIKNTDKITESHFDKDWYNDLMHEIAEKKSGQKELDKKRADELKENLFEDEKMPINDFIDNCRNDWLMEEEITKKLIIQWYSWDEFMSSSIDKSEKLILENLKKGAIENLHDYIFRFKNQKDLSDKYFDILKEQITKNIYFIDAVKSIPLKRAITMEDIKSWEKKLHEKNPDAGYCIDLSGEILPDFDWSKSREVFKYLAFDDKTFSQTSKEHLPEWYNPNEVFEKGKTIWLWVDDVHRMWYDGKWVGVAICDWQLKPHDDIQAKEYIVEEQASKIPDYFHASAVSSILVWKQTGIAPESDLYFFAEKQSRGKEYWWDDLINAFNQILNKNKDLPNDKKIKLISISGPLYGEWIKDLVKQLEDSWVWVFSSETFRKDFWYLNKKDPMWNPNDFENYQHCLWKIDALFVNSGDRTVADPKNTTAYRHDIQASASWAIPAVAWYYLLACQADPTMTPDRFKKLARETAHEIDSTIRDKQSGKISTETKKIKVIDIKALIQEIEEWKK